MSIKLLPTFILLFFSTIGFAQILDRIESVEYDPGNDQWFVSNNTNIVRIDKEGNESVWGTGSAAFGMEVVGDRLFVINNGRITVYNTNSMEELTNVPIPGSGFLNGMTSNGSNLIWVTDFSTNKIFELDFSDFENPTVIDLVNTIVTPNGIVYEPSTNALYYVTWGSANQILKVDLDEDPLLPPSIAASGIGLSDMDGIDQDSEGNFYVSSWSPTRITKFSNDFKSSEIIDAGLLDRPADICFSVEKNTLAIPNSGNSTVTFVNFGTTTIEQVQPKHFDLSIFPNPMSNNGIISFKADEETDLRIIALDGRNIISQKFEAGLHQIKIQDLNLRNGFYCCVLKSGVNQTHENFRIEN